MISKDRRLELWWWLLVPAMVGHFLQLCGEDVPWAPWAAARYYNTPGLHLALPPVVPYGIFVALAIAVLATLVWRRRRLAYAVLVLYLAHYLTWPFRIRNHMSHMFFSVCALGGVWLLGRRDRETDAVAVNGLAAVTCVTYAFAALHKMNAHFFAFDASHSSAVEGLTTFWIYGDLGQTPPSAAMAIAIWGTVIIEALAPILAWRVKRLRVPLILVLFAFHFPHVAVMNVADYPMIASLGYVAFFDRAHFDHVLRHAGPSRWTVAGATVGIAAQLWWIPWWGALTIFGIFVCALWGWAAGAMLRSELRPMSAESC